MNATSPPPPPHLKNPCFYQKIQAGDLDRIQIPASFLQQDDLEDALLPGPVTLKTKYCESAVNLFFDDRGSAFLSGDLWRNFLNDNNFGEGYSLLFTHIEGSLLDVQAIPEHVPHRDQDLNVAETSRSRKQKVTFAASSIPAGISRNEDQDMVLERHIGKGGVPYKAKRPSPASTRAAGMPIIRKRGSSKPTSGQVPISSPLGFSSGSSTDDQMIRRMEGRRKVTSSELASLQQEAASHEHAIKHYQHQLDRHLGELRKANASITDLMVKQMQKLSRDYSDLKSFVQKED